MSRLRSSCASFAFASAALALSSASAGEDEERKKAMATDLFDQGVRLMVSKRCDEVQPIPPADRAVCSEALDFFVKATRAYPNALGAHRNAAFVARGLGKIASAARSFREVARRAPLEPSESRRRWAPPAAKEADALEPRVPHVVVALTAGSPDGLKLTLDGDTLDPRLVKTSIALDPGPHELTIESADFLPATRQFQLVEKQKLDLSIALEPKPKAAPIATVPPTEAPPPPPPSKVGPITLLAGGASLIAVGLVFGALASSAKSDCAANVCQTQSDIDRARSRATASTVFTVLGSALAAGGAVWWVALPGKSQKTGLAPFATPQGGGIAAVGVLP